MVTSCFDFPRCRHAKSESGLLLDAGLLQLVACCMGHGRSYAGQGRVRSEEAHKIHLSKYSD